MEVLCEKCNEEYKKVNEAIDLSKFCIKCKDIVIKSFYKNKKKGD